MSHEELFSYALSPWSERKWITKYKMPLCCDSLLFQADRRRKEIVSLSVEERSQGVCSLVSHPPEQGSERMPGRQAQEELCLFCFLTMFTEGKRPQSICSVSGKMSAAEYVYPHLRCNNSTCFLLPTRTNDYIWKLEYIADPPRPQIPLPTCRVYRLPSIYLRISDGVYANVKAFLKVS